MEMCSCKSYWCNSDQWSKSEPHTSSLCISYDCMYDFMALQSSLAIVVHQNLTSMTLVCFIDQFVCHMLMQRLVVLSRRSVCISHRHSMMRNGLGCSETNHRIWGGSCFEAKYTLKGITYCNESLFSPPSLMKSLRFSALDWLLKCIRWKLSRSLWFKTIWLQTEERKHEVSFRSIISAIMYWLKLWIIN